MAPTPLACLLVLALSSAPVAATEAPAPGLSLALQLQDVFAGIAADVMPSVASITAYARTPAPPVTPSSSVSAPAAPSSVPPPAAPDPGWLVADSDEEAEGYPGHEAIGRGSGFFINRQHQVLCPARIVTLPDGRAADIIDVETQDERHFLARLVGTEPTLDLAVLEIAAFPPRWPPLYVPAPVGSTEQLRPGHWLIALGDPPGPEKTVAVGLLASLPSRQCYQDQLTATQLQTSLTLPAGSHGGPLVDLAGHVVGITLPRGPASARGPASTSGHEVALPIDLALNVATAIAASGSQRSPWLGFSVLDAAELLERTKPAEFAAISRPAESILIDDVHAAGPGARAGVLVGDWLAAMNDVPIPSVFEFQRRLYLEGIGASLRLRLQRDGRTLELTLAIEQRPAAIPAR